MGLGIADFGRRNTGRFKEGKFRCEFRHANPLVRGGLLVVKTYIAGLLESTVEIELVDVCSFCIGKSISGTVYGYHVVEGEGCGLLAHR